MSNDPIPVATTAWYLSRFDTAALPTTNLQSEVLQEQSVHGALEAHVQFADLALSKSEEADVRNVVVACKLRRYPPDRD